MKKIISVMLLSFLLFLNPLSLQEAHYTEAASVFYVVAKQDIYLHSEPTKDATKIATIKNHSEVKVFSANETWSYIQVGNVKGYVYTNALSKKNPKETAPAQAVTGGLSPKAGRSYTYNPSFEEDGRKMTYFATKRDGVTELLNADGYGYAYLESAKAFEMGVANSDVFFFSLSYPMKKGSTIVDTDYGIEENTITKVLVKSTSTTIKTVAGTFNNVLVLNYPNGAQLYVAQGYGIIKIVNALGQTTAELVQVK